MPCMGLPHAPSQISPDGLTYRFLLRPGIKFHDGSRADRARRRLLAADSQGQGASDCAAAAARLRRRRCRRRRHRGGAFRSAARARRAAVRRGLPDLFAQLLFQPCVRRDHAGGAARLRAIQGRPLRRRPLYRIRARQGLVGRRSSGLARKAQFRRGSLRILPRSRRRLRRLHRQELSVPRGVHLAHLGHALRFPRPPRRPGQARRDCGPDAVGRARLVLQHAARQVQGQAAA